MCERPKYVRESIKTIDKLMIGLVKYDGIHVANKFMFNVSSRLYF